MMPAQGTGSPAILAIDTSGSFCSIALARGHDMIARRARVGNAHTQHVLPMLRTLLDEAAFEIAACDAIAFSAGPGAFTGLRVACALAQGLAFGARILVVPIGTLVAMAHSATASDEAVARRAETVLVAHDARMGEVYWSLVSSDGHACTETAGPFVTTPRAMRTWLEQRGERRLRLGVGNAWSAYPEAMHDLADEVAHRESTVADDVARLGQVAWREGRAIDPSRAAPLYVRDEVALTTAQREARVMARSAETVGT